MQDYPIPNPSSGQSVEAEKATSRLIDLARQRQSTTRELLDWLKVEHEIHQASTRLQNPIGLDSDALIAEVKKLRGKKNPLSVAAVRNLRDEHARTVIPAQAEAREARGLEQRISDLVNEAYGLTPAEVRLMWETAPPRMPVAPPPGIGDRDS
jgi:hypothetical protein